MVRGFRTWCGRDEAGWGVGGPSLLYDWRERASVSSGRGAWHPHAGPQALPRGSAAGLACQKLRRDGGGSGTPNPSSLVGLGA